MQDLQKVFRKNYFVTPKLSDLESQRWGESCICCAFCLPLMQVGRRALSFHRKPHSAGCKRAWHVSLGVEGTQGFVFDPILKNLQASAG